MTTSNVSTETERPFILGIAGGTCSGKSTLAHVLRQRLGETNCTILCMDRYYRQHGEPIDFELVDFDSPSMIDVDRFRGDVEFLAARREVLVPEYDRKMHQVTGSVKLEPATFIILEGLFLLVNEEIRKQIDFSIYLDTDPQLRLSRRIQRDTVEYGLQPASVHANYRRYTYPAHVRIVEPTKRYATVVLPGSELAQAVSQVLITLCNIQTHPNAAKLAVRASTKR